MNHGISALMADLPNGLIWMLLAFAAVESYLLGCINGAVVVSKHILQDDVRNHGSGNAGLTNFYRTFGGKLSFAVIAADVLKTMVAVLLAVVPFLTVMPVVPVFVRFWAGLFCCVGHMFPCMFQFRGGKGILSGGALVLLLDWRIALATIGIFILVVFFTRLVSLASCTAAVVLPIVSVVVYRAPSIFFTALLMGLLILWQHRGNLIRISQGKERQFTFKREKQVKS